MHGLCEQCIPLAAPTDKPYRQAELARVVQLVQAMQHMA